MAKVTGNATMTVTIFAMGKRRYQEERECLILETYGVPERSGTP